MLSFLAYAVSLAKLSALVAFRKCSLVLDEFSGKRFRAGGPSRV